MSILHLNADNFTESIKTDKTVLIDFWAPWCGPCRMLGPILEEVAEENPELVVAKVNVDEEADLAQAFGVTSIPLLVVMKDGKPVNQSVGLIPKEKVLELVQ